MEVAIKFFFWLIGVLVAIFFLVGIPGYLVIKGWGEHDIGFLIGVVSMAGLLGLAPTAIIWYVLYILCQAVLLIVTPFIPRR